MKSHDQLDDHQLMQRICEGDALAFEALESRWEPKIFRVLRRLTHNEQDAEDLSQETFFRVLDSSHRYHSGHAFSTWIYRIAINLARDAARQRKVAIVDGELTKECEPHFHILPDHQAQQRELAEQIEAALAELPANHREIIVLKHYSDLTFAEIAATLEAPSSTVKSRAAAALRILRNSFRRRGIDKHDVNSVLE